MVVWGTKQLDETAVAIRRLTLTGNHLLRARHAVGRLTLTPFRWLGGRERRR